MKFLPTGSGRGKSESVKKEEGRERGAYANGKKTTEAELNKKAPLRSSRLPPSSILSSTEIKSRPLPFHQI